MDLKKIEVQELLNLDDIESEEMLYLKKYGYFPFNVSTWNPSSYFSQKFLDHQLELPSLDYISYIYSYELNHNLINTVESNLGGNNLGCTIVNTGTSAISLVTSVLKQVHVKRVLLVCPIYYSVIYNFLEKGIAVDNVYMHRKNNGYALPREEIMNKIAEVDAIWITNPIYNTGIYLDIDDINFLKCAIPSRITLICDDCFANCGMEMVRYLGSRPQYISIHDPLKQIMINGLKFSCVLYSLQYEHIFEQWSDIVCGSLSYSTLQSVEFFISEKFKQIRLELQSHFLKMDKYFEELSREFPLISIDNRDHLGHMRMCYMHHLPFDFLEDKENLHNFIDETGTSIIPGNRFHFSNNCGFCFRVNYGRECSEFWDALIQIFIYLSEHN